MCIGVHDIVSFGDQSAKAEKSQYLVRPISGVQQLRKMGYEHFDHNMDLIQIAFRQVLN